jgi:hypothetical protein
MNIVLADERWSEGGEEFCKVWVHCSLEESGLGRREENALVKEAEGSIDRVEGVYVEGCVLRYERDRGVERWDS